MERADSGWVVECRDGLRLAADAVIVAVGGVSAGGIRLAREGETPPRGAIFLSIDAPVALGLDGERLLGASSVRGPTLAKGGLSALERIGIVTDGARAADCHAVYAAGDVVAGRPRTMLASVESGIEAARVALADH
jgi:thioredoxin reductase